MARHNPTPEPDEPRPRPVTPDNTDASVRNSASHRLQGVSEPPRRSRPRIDSAGGLLLSALPSAVLAPLNAMAGPAGAVAFAAVLATTIAIARVRRGHAKGPAFGGLVGVMIAGVAAWSTGSGSGLFLPDLAWYAIAAVGLTGSILVGRPLIGVLWLLVNQPEPARRAAARGRDFTLATAASATVAIFRFIVTRLLAAHQTDPLLVTLKVATGFPLTLAAFAIAAWAWRRASPRRLVGHRIARCSG
ncbi:DUF3159 domain-containing protein [Amycolatopsis sp. OK19-0408]|uniref:DUF3159 domain-containing protein n=1 Tax=Amycolatopsis iheyensis TaxID=2945988 RepID=A0A9X2NMV7_9PSEU|nr:DUF3159 domain-containing protein [Amycolatopsis iheyensis]MCR6489815.1 DUF3159 domain-containing protein [Amycolatopsis iheyensis]